MEGPHISAKYASTISIRNNGLLKQLKMMNKQLKLQRAQPANTNTSVPLENVKNLLGVVANVLPSTASSY
jgi:hypothetical protein